MTWRPVHRRSPASPGADMATMHFTEKMTAAPEHFIAALTDLGEGREKAWANSGDNYL
jgi:hypothetical protein